MKKRKSKILISYKKETKNHGLLYTSKCTARKVKTPIYISF